MVITKPVLRDVSKYRCNPDNRMKPRPSQPKTSMTRLRGPAMGTLPEAHVMTILDSNSAGSAGGYGRNHEVWTPF